MGMKADYARTLIARMEETAREIDVPVGGEPHQSRYLTRGIVPLSRHTLENQRLGLIQPLGMHNREQ